MWGPKNGLQHTRKKEHEKKGGETERKKGKKNIAEKREKERKRKRKRKRKTK